MWNAPPSVVSVVFVVQIRLLVLGGTRVIQGAGKGGASGVGGAGVCVPGPMGLAVGEAGVGGWGLQPARARPGRYEGLRGRRADHGRARQAYASCGLLKR